MLQERQKIKIGDLVKLGQVNKMDAKWKIRLMFAAIVVGAFVLVHFGIFAGPTNLPVPL